MTEFIFGSYRLLADAEAARAYYAAHPGITCGCAGCRNFVRAVKTLPSAAVDFFAALGLDPEKAAEVYAIDQEESAGICLYGAFYHLPGELSALGKPLAIAEGFSAAFQADCNLLQKDFPQPCVQLEAEFRLPWLLEEENLYAHIQEEPS